MRVVWLLGVSGGGAQKQRQQQDGSHSLLS
jgi:hypothetical protein